MAIDRCIAIVTPLKAGKIRVNLYKIRKNKTKFLHIILIGTLFMW